MQLTEKMRYLDSCEMGRRLHRPAGTDEPIRHGCRLKFWSVKEAAVYCGAVVRHYYVRGWERPTYVVLLDRRDGRRMRPVKRHIHEDDLRPWTIKHRRGPASLAAY